MPNTYQGYPVSAPDWRIEIVRLIFGGQSAGIAIAGLLMAYAIYSLAQPLSQIPASLNNMTTQMKQVEVSLDKYSGGLDTINKRLTAIETNTNKGKQP